MKIKELSNQTGVNLETIRYYEKTGLLPLPSRGSNGYRFYQTDSIGRLNFIKTCRSLGFSIEDIKQLNILKSAPENHILADRMIAQQLEQVNEKINQLNGIKIFLQGLVLTEIHSHDECQVFTGLQNKLIVDKL